MTGPCGRDLFAPAVRWPGRLSVLGPSVDQPQPCGHQPVTSGKAELGPAKQNLMYVIVITFCTKNPEVHRNRFVGCESS